MLICRASARDTPRGRSARARGDAGLLRPAERRDRVERCAVDVDLPTPDAPRDARRALGIAAPHRAAEAVDRIVRVRTASSSSSYGMMQSNGAEISSCRSSCRCGRSRTGGADVVAALEAGRRVVAAGDERGAFGDAVLDVIATRSRCVADTSGPSRAVPTFGRRPSPSPPRPSRSAPPRRGARAHQHARPRGTGLAGVDVAVPRRRCGPPSRSRRVVEDHVRRLAAELEARPSSPCAPRAPRRGGRRASSR